MYSQIAANKRKTVYLIIFFILLVGILGWVFSMFATGDPSITVYVVISALVYAAIAYFISSKAALALNRAQPIAKKITLDFTGLSKT